MSISNFSQLLRRQSHSSYGQYFLKPDQWQENLHKKSASKAFEIEKVNAELSIKEYKDL